MFKKSLFITSIFIASLFAYSCGETKGEKTQEQEDEGEEYYSNKDYTRGTIAIYVKALPYIDSFKTVYDSVKYFCVLDTNYLFYVKMGNKTGVVDMNGKIIIPVEYSKIYTPGGTAKGYIEVEKNNLRGLYSIQGDQVVPAEYNSIYPYTKQKEVIVQLRKGNLFGAALTDGSIVFEGEEHEPYFQSPFKNQTVANWKINIHSKDLILLRPAEYENYDEDPSEGLAILITPSYLVDFGIYPPNIESIIVGEADGFGVVKSEAEVTDVESLWGNIKAIFTKYYEEGISGRDYEVEKGNIITVDSNGRVIGNIQYEAPFMPATPCEDELYSGKFIDSSLYELKQYSYTYGDETPYYAHNKYTYYQINTDGMIKELECDREYPFTKFVVIDENYIKGCFVTEKEARRVNDGGGTNEVKTQKYLSVYDLEVMKNEIYADYGLKFKAPIWQKYFKKKGWYNPVFDSVESILTETDKRNISFIDKMIEKMKANPKKYNETGTGRLFLMP